MIMYVVDSKGLVLQQGRCEEDLWVWIQESTEENLTVYLSKQRIIDRWGKFEWASKKHQQQWGE